MNSWIYYRLIFGAFSWLNFVERTLNEIYTDLVSHSLYLFIVNCASTVCNVCVCVCWSVQFNHLAIAWIESILFTRNTHLDTSTPNHKLLMKYFLNFSAHTNTQIHTHSHNTQTESKRNEIENFPFPKRLVNFNFVAISFGRILLIYKILSHHDDEIQRIALFFLWFVQFWKHVVSWKRVSHSATPYRFGFNKIEYLLFAPNNFSTIKRKFAFHITHDI